MTQYELEQYLGRYRKNVFAMALFYLKSPNDADDVVQDVFLKLYTYTGTFDSEEHIRAWLIRCTVNRCKDILHSNWYRFSEPLDAAGDKVHTDAPAEEGRVYGMLKKLGKNNRVALYLYYYEGYSTEEIARMLGISVIAVTSRLKRGRKQLKKLLTDTKEN